MGPTRARRVVGTGAAVLAAAVTVGGCGAGPAPRPLSPATTGGSVEADVCTTVQSAAGGLLIGLFLDNVGRSTAQSTARLQAGVVRYADVVRTEAARTTDPVLRPVLDRAVAAAEDAADVTTVDELRRTPFKDATIEVGRVCREMAGGGPRTLPTARPTPDAKPSIEPAEPDEPAASGGPFPAAGRTGLGPICGVPVTFDVPDGWVPDPTDVDPDSGLATVYTNGPFLQKCSIEAIYAGHPGNVTVAVAPGSAADMRREVDEYLAEIGQPDAYEVRDATRTELRVAGRPAIEVDFETVSQYGTTTAAICVVTVPDGLVLLRMNTVTDFDVAPIREGYELAKRTLRES